jgi:glycosyltransferase involved in cell wall biosynthesis
MEKILIIIPAYNEEKRISKTLEEYGAFFEEKRKEGKIDYELLIVINNTKDKTEEIVKKYAKKNRRINYLNFKRGGKGFAIIEGFKYSLKNSNNDLIGFVDADCSTPALAFYDLIKNIGVSDGIIASRWVKGSEIKTKQSFLRRLLSRGFNFLVKALFFMSYNDTQCGAKIFTKRTIRKILPDLNITQWAFDVNLLYLCKKDKFSIKEWPTTWEDKKDTKLNVVKVPFEMFSGILRLRLLNSPLKFLVKIYDSLPERIKVDNKLRKES